MKGALPLRRRLLYIGLMHLIVLVPLFAYLELWARYSAPPPPDGYMVGSRRFNHTLKPASQWLHDEWVALNPDWPEPYLHQYNAEGWLETYAPTKAKPGDVFRIFYVGDSFIEGTAPMPESVPSLVEAGLAAAPPRDDVRFEVINTGTPSYSPLIYYLVIRYKILDYDPDLVVVAVDMTDDFDDWKYRQTAIYDEDGAPFACPPRDATRDAFVDSRSGVVRATWLTRMQLALYERSAFFRSLQRAQTARLAPTPQMAEAAARAAGVYPRWAWCHDEWDATTQANVAKTFDVLRQTAALLEARGVRMMLTGVPHHQQYSSDPSGQTPPEFSARPHFELEALAAELGVPYLNSYVALEPVLAGTPQDAYYYRGDMHFNPRGYAAWARVHLDFLRDPRNRLLTSRANTQPD